MTSFGESALGKEASEGQTISQLHLRAERSRERKTVMRHWAEGRWVDMPAWRFYRQVIRVGLYLRERLHVGSGDRVAFLSPLRPERIVADWAAVVQGAVVATLDTRLPPEAVGSALTQLVPKVTFVAGSSERALLLQVSGQGASVGEVVVFDDAGPDGGSPPAAAPSVPSAPNGEPWRAHPWSHVLDHGGTLDTAERAQKFRAIARAVGTDAPALAHTEGSNGVVAWQFLMHREVVRRVETFRAKAGDVAYVVGGPLSHATLLALRAFLGDGRTTTVIGTPGREAEEIAELRPHVLVAPSEIIDRAVKEPGPNGHGAARAWLQRIRSLSPLGQLQRWPWIQPAARGAAEDERLRDVMTLDGTRVGPRNRTTGDAQ